MEDGFSRFISGLADRLGLSFAPPPTPAQDEKRLANLQAAFSATPMGAALLAYAYESNISFSLQHDMSYGLQGAILNENLGLNSAASDDELIGSIAHEIFHDYQRKILGDAVYHGVYTLPPEGAVAANRYLEAGAFSFEQKFVEDYAVRTGNTKPLEACCKAHNIPPEALGKDDATRFSFHAERVKKWGEYEERTLNRSQIQSKDAADYFPRNPQIKPYALHDRQAGVAIARDIARQVDTPWPYKAGEGRPAHYLEGMSDSRLETLGAPCGRFGAKLNAANKAYERLGGVFTNNAPAAEAGGPKASSSAFKPSMAGGGKS